MPRSVFPYLIVLNWNAWCLAQKRNSRNIVGLIKGTRKEGEEEWEKEKNLAHFNGNNSFPSGWAPHNAFPLAYDSSIGIVLEHVDFPWTWKHMTFSKRTFRINSERNSSPFFKQRFSLTGFPSLLTSIFIQLWRYFLPLLTTALLPCFLRKKEVFSTSRYPSFS